SGAGRSPPRGPGARLPRHPSRRRWRPRGGAPPAPPVISCRPSAPCGPRSCGWGARVAGERYGGEVPDDDRRRTVEASEAMAPGWERRRARIDESLAPVRRWLVDALAPAPGDTLLELAAAPGDPGLGPGG